MLRHLSPVPKRSTMTRSDRPASFNDAARTEPINPPPPVITSIAVSPSSRVVARLGLDRVDQPGCRAPLDQIDQDDPPARSLHVGGADDGLDLIVAAFDQNIGLQAPDQLDRGFLVEADDRIDRL